MNCSTKNAIRALIFQLLDEDDNEGVVEEATEQNADGLPIETGLNIPLTAGVDQADPATTLHDAAIPEKLHTSRGEFNLRLSHDFHERVEYALMQAGLSYDDAHRYATEAEHKRARDLGFDPNEIEELAKPFIDAAAHRAKATGYQADPTVDNQPYRDSGEEGLLNRGGEEVDERCYYDRDGGEYSCPEQYRALGKIDFVIAESPSGFSAIEPSSATVWLSRSTREGAEKAIDDRVRSIGTKRAKAKIDAEPPISQQQLQELYDAKENASEENADENANEEDAAEE
jgi:hypothetical protein